MITKKQQKKLKEFRPPNYPEYVKEYVSDKYEKHLSENTIKAVFLGQRTNYGIANYIIEAFSDYKEKQVQKKKELDKKIESLLSQK